MRVIPLLCYHLLASLSFICISDATGPKMNSDVVTYYIIVVVLGAIGGLIRFNESDKEYSARLVATSISIGSMISFVIIGFLYGSDIIIEPIKPLATSIAIGYVQPPIVDFVGWIMKNRGGRGPNDNG